MPTAPPSAALPSLPQLQKDFTCVHGEEVSRAVHNARIAAADPLCEGCAHAPEFASRDTELDHGNLRGRYLQSIDRDSVRRWGQSLAATMIATSSRANGGADPRTLTGNSDSNRSAPASRHSYRTDESSPRTSSQRATTDVRPQVVIGHDGRPSSPDLAVGLDALSIGGCDVIDIGTTLRPMFDLAVRRAGADCGVYLTGGGRPAGWTGLDIVGRGAAPWSWPGSGEAALTQPSVDRAVRRSGAVRHHTIDQHYFDDVAAECHGLRPLTLLLLVGCDKSREVLDVLSRVVPGRVLIEQRPAEDHASLANELQQLRYDGFPLADLTCRIATDGRSLTALDETGSAISPLGLATGLSELSVHSRVRLREQEATEEEIESDASPGEWLVSGRLITGTDRSGCRRRDAFWLLTKALRRLAVSDAAASQVFRSV